MIAIGMNSKKNLVSEIRKYAVTDVKSAKGIANIWINQFNLEKIISFGLPEIDDRYHIWRVPLKNKNNKKLIGEVVIDAKTSLIIEEKSTRHEVLEARLLERDVSQLKSNNIESTGRKIHTLSVVRNTIALGDSEEIMQEFPAESINLIFTSPPYYNARPEYTDYITYEEYLLKIRKIIQQSHRILSEGRFFIINISPVLIRRANRNEASKRIAVPFDFHRIFIEEGFDFIDDIIWVKPEGAGWATGRGRRFAADRNPLQYKAVPVTEYILVYRKHTDKLIDWNIRNHPDQSLVKDSKINDNYEKTNIWKITPSYDKRHPAIFPVELAEKVIRYYSFKNDVILDPFGGIGTVGKAAVKLNRRFVLIEKEKKYASIIIEEAKRWLGKDANNIFTINLPSINSDYFL